MQLSSFLPSSLSFCPSALPDRIPDIFRIVNRTAYQEKPCLLGLPNDILVDRIFARLEVLEVLRLRCVRARFSFVFICALHRPTPQVCKLLYYLTHHAVIWKRFLRFTHLPIPPLPPTMRHCLRNLTSFEAERLLTRAVSLERNWNWCNPEVLDSWKFDAFHRVKEMILLPGSQYMVASVSETSGQDWSLVVFVMDGRYNVVPLAKTPTGTRAYNLQAKYMSMDGVVGITIAYVRRAWRHRGDAKKGSVAFSSKSYQRLTRWLQC